MSFLLLFQSGKSRLASSRGNNDVYDGEESGSIGLGSIAPALPGSAHADITEISSGTSELNEKDFVNPAPSELIITDIVIESSQKIGGPRAINSTQSSPTKTIKTGGSTKKDGDITGSVTST